MVEAKGSECTEYMPLDKRIFQVKTYFRSRAQEERVGTTYKYQTIYPVRVFLRVTALYSGSVSVVSSCLQLFFTSRHIATTFHVPRWYGRGGIKVGVSRVDTAYKTLRTILFLNSPTKTASIVYRGGLQLPYPCTKSAVCRRPPARVMATCSDRLCF